MESAIRWSATSSEDNERFLQVDVVSKVFRLCRVTNCNESVIQYETIATHRKIPSFRAFDWSTTNEAIAAVGQSSGEVTVLRIDDGSQDTISLPVRISRSCNAVAFNTEALLAAGLDKVRTDYCLNIYDLAQRIPLAGTRGFGGQVGGTEPLYKLAGSEPITSIKFFHDKPQSLVAGVKGQYIRIYDLRQQSQMNGALQFATRCVNNIAIDPLDENYFASCVHTGDPTVCVWDRRYGATSAVTTPLSGAHNMRTEKQAESSLQFTKGVIDTPGTIWSVRFSKTQRGCLGVLSSTGHLKMFEIGKEAEWSAMRYSARDDHEEASIKGAPEALYLDQVNDIERAYFVKDFGRDEKQRIVTFDFMTNFSVHQQPGLIVMTSDGAVKKVTATPMPRPYDISATGQYLASSNRGALKSFNAADNIEGAETRIEWRLGATDHAALKKLHVSKNDFAGAGVGSEKMPINDILTMTSIQRLRCKAGYAFSPLLNKQITKSQKWLSAMWSWLDRANRIAGYGQMVYEGVDLSFIGVHSIWEDDLGISAQSIRFPPSSLLKTSAAIAGLTRQLEIPGGRMCETEYEYHRRLALHTLNLTGSIEDLRSRVRGLAEEGENTKAAAMAIFANETKLAFQALRSGGATAAHKMLALAISGAAHRCNRSSSEEESVADDDWSNTISGISDELEDPYARAILALVRTDDFEKVTEVQELPLKYRLGVALRWFKRQKSDISHIQIDQEGGSGRRYRGRDVDGYRD